jgi:hypothetical protein
LLYNVYVTALSRFIRPEVSVCMDWYRIVQNGAQTLKAHLIAPIFAGALAAGVLLASISGTSGHTPETTQSVVPPAPPGVPTPPPDLASRRPPTSSRELSPPLPSEAPASTGTICDVPGTRLRGGETFRLGKLSVDLPRDHDYVVSVMLQENGTFVRACAVQLDSSVAFALDGKESFRIVNQANANAVLDSVLDQITVER